MVSPISGFYEWLADIILEVVLDLVKLLLPGAIVVGVYLLLQKQKTPEAAAATFEQSGQKKQNQNVGNIATPRRTSQLSHQSREIDLLLIGKTGNGKSATGNSILWRLRRKPFDASTSSTSVTAKVSSEVTVYKGRRITVVDGPGVGDTREGGIDIVDKGLQNAIEINDKGYHAFLLVVKMGVRFNQDDINTVELLKNYFGGSAFLSKYCILVITGGDIFESEREGSGKSFKQWCDEQQGVLKQIMSECDKRIVLFDNLTKDETQKSRQLDKLLQLVESLPSGRRYCDEHFELAKHSREKAIVNQKKPHINKEMLQETSLILQKVQEIQTMDEPSQQLKPLNDQKRRLDFLYENIKAQDKGTGALHDVLEAVENLRRGVFSQTELCQQLITEGQVRKEDRDEFEAKMAEERKKLDKAQADYDKLKKKFESKVASNSQGSSGRCMIL